MRWRGQIDQFETETECKSKGMWASVSLYDTKAARRVCNNGFSDSNGNFQTVTHDAETDPETGWKSIACAAFSFAPFLRKMSNPPHLTYFVCVAQYTKPMCVLE